MTRRLSRSPLIDPEVRREILERARRIDELAAQRHAFGIYLPSELPPTVSVVPRATPKPGTCRILIKGLISASRLTSSRASCARRGMRRLRPLDLGRDYLAWVARDQSRAKAIGFQRCIAVTPIPKRSDVWRCRLPATDGGYCEEHASRTRPRFDPLSLLTKRRCC